MTREEYLERAKFIWKNYVPARGSASTKVGELMRFNEKLRDESQRNGNKNWDEEHETMAVFVRDALLKAGIFDEEESVKIKASISRILDFEYPETKDEVFDHLMDRIVDWHLANPVPASATETLAVVESSPAANPAAQAALAKALGSQSPADALQAVADGADLNFIDQADFGRSPLFLAAVRGHLDMVEWLLDQGAAINVVDNLGYTPWDFAMYKKEVQCYLKSRGGLSAKKGEVKQ